MGSCGCVAGRGGGGLASICLDGYLSRWMAICLVGWLSVSLGGYLSACFLHLLRPPAARSQGPTWTLRRPVRPAAQCTVFFSVSAKASNFPISNAEGRYGV